ncbi:putative ribonuclease H-like domain-containing protein [Tanacetum coccineum]
MIPKTVLTRPFNKITAANNSNFTKKINTVKGTRVNTARPKAVFSAIKGNKGNVVKASACWGNPQQDLKDKRVIDSGCSRHMTGNRSYLTDYEEIDKGFIAFAGGLSCLFAKSTPDESNLWHRRLGHVNFNTMNKLEGKQHRASCKTKLVSSISQPLQMLHMDLFGPTFVKSLMKKMYCLVVTDDFSRYSWVFFLAPKDETSEILKTFITGIENLIDLRVKVIRCDNGTELKNRVMNQFCEMKGIKKEFSVARTLQQNGIAERKNKTLIEAAKTMLVDSKLPTTFWAEAVNTACYVQNMVLVIKPHNKTLYELFLGRKPALSFMRPFGCLVTIFNTIDHLGKFDGKADEGFFVGYSTNSKAFRVFNSRTRIVEENLHVHFSESTSNIAGSGPNWLFDIDTLTKSINYKPVVAGNQSNGNAGRKACDDAGKARVETVLGKDYILLPLWTQDPPFSSSSKDSLDAGFKPSGEEEMKDAKNLGNESGNPPKGKDSEVPSTEEPRIKQEKDASVNSTNNINTVSPIVNVANIKDNVVDENIVYGCADDPNIPDLEEVGRFSDAEDDGVEADMTNLDTHISVSPIPTTRIHKDHPVEQIIRDIHSAPQTRRMTKSVTEHAMFSSLPNGKRAIGTKWVFRNKKDERGIVIKNKARLVVQGYTQEEGINYDEVFAPVARIEAVRLFLAYASFKDFLVYQMNVNSAFLYGKIEEEVYVFQPPGFEDPDFPDRVYKVEKAFYGLHQAPRAWDKGDILLVQVYVDDIIFGSTKKSLCTEFEKMMHTKFQMSSMDKKKKFGFSDVKTASTPMETHKPLLKDADGEDIDEHMYRSMIVSLMYLTSSRPDIIYLKGQPKLGIWYPKDSPFDLVAYTNNDYAGASLDRKSTTGDSNEKKLIQMIKIHTDKNVADLLTKAFDFWSTAKIKTLNNETQIHAKVEGKTIVLSESSVRRDLQFDDEDGKKRFFRTRTPLFSSMLAQQADVGEGSGHPTDPQHTSTYAQPSNEEPITVPSSSQPKKTHRPRKAKRATKISQCSGPIPLIADETITKEREDKIERAATTASSLEAEQDSGNINRTQSMATLNEPIPQGTGSGSGPRCQGYHNGWMQKLKWLVERLTSKQSNDPPLLRVNTLRSGENRLKLKELMNLCTKLFDRVLDLETTKTAQAKEIASLKKRVKKLERKRKSKTTGMNLFKIGTSRRRSLGEEDASKQERNLKQSSIFKESDFNEEFDANMDKAIEQVYDANTDTVEEGEFQVPTTNMEVNTASTSVTAASINITTVSAPVTTVGISVNPAEPITTASKVVTTAEPSTPPTTTTTIFEDEDLTIAQTLVKMRSGRSKMKAELEEEERLARERKEDANIAESDDVQAMMDADYELAADVQHTSRE